LFLIVNFAEDTFGEMRRDDRFNVFLSYARSDGVAAEELNSWLRSRGLRTFFDRSDLNPGLRWMPALEDAIRRSDAVAILIGQHGIGNTQQYEREFALVRQTEDPDFPVIPVLMPGCETPPTGFLQLLTWIDLSQDVSVLGQTDNLEALRGAIRRQAIALSSIRTQICPYRGLEPFREEDAALFCGRDDAIRGLVSQVQAYPFVAVVGPSGSGKSSLVFAGLLPALRQQHNTTIWDVVSFRPGPSPLRALASAFGTVPKDAGPAETDAHLEKEAAAYRAGDPSMLGRIIVDRLDAAPEKPDRLLIYVDQWEELYAMAPSTEEAEQRRQHSSDVEKFVALLVAATSNQRSRATVVLTVRADFYNPLIRHTPLSTLLPKQQVNIPRMSPSDLRSSIETPAKKAGLLFAPPELVDQILNDVGLEEGRLPLLQYALKETWEKREGDRLTAKAYTEVGGVTGAIQKTAERAYAALTAMQQEAARRLFLRLVTPGEGQADTRARGAIPEDPQQREIINLFSNPRTRLLVTGHDTLQGSAAGRDLRATVEVAHEALIRRWPMLRAWVDANRETLRARAVVLRAKAEWEDQGKVDKYLLDPGIQLERGRSLLSSPGDVPVDDIRDYVDSSVRKEAKRLDAEREAALADQKRIAAAERQAKEAAEEAARQSEVARAAAEVARRKLRNRFVLATCAAVVALLAFGVSVYEAQESQRQRDKALAQRSRALAVEASEAGAAGDQPTAMLIALQALPDTGTNRPASPQASAALYQAWLNNREMVLAGHDGPVYLAQFSPDGRYVVTASADKTARVWDLKQAHPTSIALAGHEQPVYAAAFDHYGRRVVTASLDGTARVWDLSVRPVTFLVLRGHADSVLSAEFSADGRRVVTTSTDQTARVWDLSGPQPTSIELQGHRGSVLSATFSPDGSHVATASTDNTARVWDSYSGHPQFELLGHTDAVLSVAFSKDGHLVTASRDGTARVWDLSGDQPKSVVAGRHEKDVLSAAFSPDGHRIVTASIDWTARVWTETGFNPADGNRLATLSGDRKASATARWDNQNPSIELVGHKGDVVSAIFSPDGLRVATASRDGTARVWNLSRDRTTTELRGHDHWVSSVAFSPDGQSLVTASDDSTARVWGLSESRPTFASLSGHRSWVLAAALSVDGKRLVTASNDSTARVWNLSSDPPTSMALTGHTGPVLSAAFSSDGHVVTGSADATARVWNLSANSPIPIELRGHKQDLKSVSFSPDGRQVLTASLDKTARIWDWAAKTFIELKCHDGGVLSAVFNRDGTRIVTASEDKTACLWDLTGLEPKPTKLTGHSSTVRDAQFSVDNKRVVTASDDGTARVWDVSGTAPTFIRSLEGHQGAVLTAAFSPDNKYVVTASKDGTARVWDLSAKTLAPIVLNGHSNAVRSASFNQDGTVVVTASDDGTARVWDLTGEEPTSVALTGHLGGVSVAMFSPDGRHIVTGSDDTTARLWRYFPDIRDLIQIVMVSRGRCLTQAQRHRYSLPALKDTGNGTHVAAPDQAGHCPGDNVLAGNVQPSTTFWANGP
jgi:WD40 repeat protein/energy-coupling factor transporter ATP-binding protein EcfA2